MASSAQQSSVKFLAIGRLGHSELLDFYTPPGTLLNEELVDECLKVLAENHLHGTSSGDLHYHALKHEEIVFFLQHGNTRLDDLYELKLLEEMNEQWHPELKLIDFMTKMAEKPKQITRPPPRPKNLPKLEGRTQDILVTSSTSTDFTLASHRKTHATSSVDQIKLMMAEDQRFKQKAANTAEKPSADAIKLMVAEEKTSVNTPKTEDTTTFRSSGNSKDTPGSAAKTHENLQNVIILHAETTTIGHTASDATNKPDISNPNASNPSLTAPDAAVAEEMRKIKIASTNKKIFVVVILILAVIIFALVPVLAK